MAIDTEKMKALALKVGGVEWYEDGDSVCLPDGDTIACCQSSIGHMPEPIHYDDMVEYLVSVSPAKILELIAALDSANADLARLLSASRRGMYALAFGAERLPELKIACQEMSDALEAIAYRTGATP
ncbi:hypothetical protein [Burkholderia multivorans]|uniref:hypothetical protein n=1 Tax=Burkholderia multivorans TaxID=87883 RepID=UPI0020B19D14|nr:hypothetical protein [Burkholderia multivorans]